VPRASWYDPKSGEHCTLKDDILQTLTRIEQHAIELDADVACARIKARVERGDSDAAWCRGRFAELGSAPELMRAQAIRWQGA